MKDFQLKAIRPCAIWNLGLRDEIFNRDFLTSDPTFQYISWSVGKQLENDSIIAYGRNVDFSPGCYVFLTSASAIRHNSDWLSKFDETIRDSFWVIAGYTLRSDIYPPPVGWHAVLAKMPKWHIKNIYQRYYPN